jgi:hypothetical protein
MSTNVYDLHRVAFASVGAYAISRDGERIASVAFRFPHDGAGRLWCYVHVFGTEMVRSCAGGYGYDKCSAAVASAVARIKAPEGEAWAKDAASVRAIQTCLSGDSGQHWDRRLQDAGFTVWQAV